MRLLIILLLFSCSLSLSAQRRRMRLEQDSMGYYYRQLNEMRRVTMDSLYKSEAYLNAQANIDRLRATSPVSQDYIAMALFGEYCHTDYSRFNSHNAQSGFGPLPGGLARIGFGISFAHGRRMFDFYYGVAGFANRVKKGDERISANLANLFQMDWGYCIVKHNNFRLYPYAGLSMRFASIRYSAPDVATGNNTNITTMLQGNNSITLQSTKPGYQAGLGFELLVSGNKNKDAGVLLFVKAGTNSAFTKEKYRYRDITYQPGIRQGDWAIALGVKIFGRG